MDFCDTPLDIDPGLFDAKPTGSITSGSSTSDGVTELRRSYKPVPVEEKESLEYAIRRKQNNQAVRRCRTLGKVKHKSLLIKTAGYQNLSEKYRTATGEMEAARKTLETLFRQQLISGSAAQEVQKVRLAIEAEAKSRSLFDSRIESARQQYLAQLEDLSKDAEILQSPELSSHSSEASFPSSESTSFP
ncbi:unnamed protein product [Dibothriocephalus latus]|uniref:BZIP domain-containing protein n=1 Tax=Dibothriocephalus latus TaxID=60516 RepID=A0A3P7LL80_DIBLA|nr:unnamed protein product [Dibothriocephalus latus]